ncbi:MAG: hypothetical protein QOE70_2375 [Chthoniobacter sp.]|jgi:hypothetical protein|nr:hypothetical protein [Chthoniobacter sp.]
MNTDHYCLYEGRRGTNHGLNEARRLLGMGLRCQALRVDLARRSYALMNEPAPQTAEDFLTRSLRRQREREQREEEAFLREMDRKSRLFSHTAPNKVPDEFPKQLSADQIAKAFRL